ncbi:MAG: hypothetical protein Q3988_06070 [Gemella sp.]|nr:hypothetical protein [Gemella sp.]
MKKIVKILIGLGLILGVSIVGYIYVQLNLLNNSVYYAKHTPHKEGAVPEMSALLENMSWHYSEGEILPGVVYDRDGNNIIYFNNRKEIMSTERDGYRYSIREKERHISYNYDHNFKFIRAMEDPNSDKPIKEIMIADNKKEEMKKEMYNKLKPLIDEHTEPSINLQWIFDWKYKERFN